MPKCCSSGTLSRLSPPYTLLDEVPIMANYQPPHNFTPDHRGENNVGAQSAGSSHPVQHAQGVMDGTSAHPLPTQVPLAKEAEETHG